MLVCEGFLLLLSSLFYSLILLKKDKDLKLFMLPIGMGMKRKEYLLSFFMGIIFVQFLLFLTFLLFDLFFVIVIENSIYFPLFYQLFLFFLQSVLVGFIIIFLSEYVSVFNSLIYATTIFIIGSALDEVYLFFKHLKFLYFIFPNFYLFDFTALVTNRANLNPFSFIFFHFFILLFGVQFFTILL